jgi:hypothetical protein
LTGAKTILIESDVMSVREAIKKRSKKRLKATVRLTAAGTLEIENTGAL